jgi:hypothetical protein
VITSALHSYRDRTLERKHTVSRPAGSSGGFLLGRLGIACPGPSSGSSDTTFSSSSSLSILGISTSPRGWRELGRAALGFRRSRAHGRRLKPAFQAGLGRCGVTNWPGAKTDLVNFGVYFLSLPVPLQFMLTLANCRQLGTKLAYGSAAAATIMRRKVCAGFGGKKAPPSATSDC